MALAMRIARVNDDPLLEVRIGLTWATLVWVKTASPRRGWHTPSLEAGMKFSQFCWIVVLLGAFNGLESGTTKVARVDNARRSFPDGAHPGAASVPSLPLVLVADVDLPGRARLASSPFLAATAATAAPRSPAEMTAPNAAPLMFCRARHTPMSRPTGLVVSARTNAVA
jgi:hypothetical protein